MASELVQNIVTIIQVVAPPLLSLGGVWLGWQLNSKSQRQERRLARLREDLRAIREIRGAVEDIPPDLSADELRTKLETDDEFRRSLSGRLVRLFGLRSELIPFIDREIVDFIDGPFRSFYVIATGRYSFRDDQIPHFAVAAVQLREIAARVEQRLVMEYEKLRK